MGALTSAPITLQIGDARLVVGQISTDVAGTTHTNEQLTVHLSSHVEFDPGFAAFVNEHTPPPRETA